MPLILINLKQACHSNSIENFKETKALNHHRILDFRVREIEKLVCDIISCSFMSLKNLRNLF